MVVIQALTAGYVLGVSHYYAEAEKSQVYIQSKFAERGREKTEAKFQ